VICNDKDDTRAVWDLLWTMCRFKLIGANKISSTYGDWFGRKWRGQ